MQYMVIDHFLKPMWLEFVCEEIKRWKGRLSREGYDNEKTLRDSFDPRYAETAYIRDSNNVLCKVWDKFLWNSQIEDDLKASEDSAMVHATYTKYGKTLLSSYGDSDRYGHHVDVELDCIVTAVLMLHLSDEKKFSGGDFQLLDETIKFKNNRVIIFPSCRMHGVTPVKLESDTYNDRRFTLQYFISSVTPRKRFPDESSNQ
jgi:Rps23 Pro-64 3,4-dihydroxylase Tpa1-like proline 4-hydroxylase